MTDKCGISVSLNTAIQYVKENWILSNKSKKCFVYLLTTIKSVVIIVL